MEKKIKALILIAIIAGAGVAVGVTAGIIMSQQGAMDQILLLLAMRPPGTVPRTWTWVSGNDTIYETGIYGTKGVPAAENVPGTRYGSVSWTDSDDNLWLFGGNGWDRDGPDGFLNDLWMFNITSGWWMWVSGSDTSDHAGTYGTMGVPAAANVPGTRANGISWMDSDDNLWLFGGEGRDRTGAVGYLNDVWMFNITSSWWMWVSGNDTRNIKGTYGTMGVPAADNVPGTRYGSVSWTDFDDNLWLFGGQGLDGAGSSGYLNDLWMFNSTSSWWMWVSGNDTISQKGIYGTQRMPAAGNVPGSRKEGSSWTSSDGNLWLFGGQGLDGAGSSGYLNDLWMFSSTSGWWMWVSGNDTRNINGTYGTQGMPAAANIPGARECSVSWMDSNDNLWLFGGRGQDSAGSLGYLQDLWMFDITSGWWTWVAGNDTISQKGIYGTQGVPAGDNIPGARRDSASWTDSDYTLWLFGGMGYDSAGDFGDLNDLWKYQC